MNDGRKVVYNTAVWTSGYSLKKKVKLYEEEFEREYGYRPSHADKMGNKDIKRMYAEMNKLRKEVKCECCKIS